MQSTFLNVLKFPDFKKIWLSQVFSQIALNMVTFALVLDIFEKTKSNTSISLVMIASAIPVAIFGPFSGAIADRICYRKILMYTNIFRFVAAILLIVAHSNILAMLEIIFLISALSQFFTPAESSSIPLIVPKEKLVHANSLVMTTTYITLLIGYASAGPIMNYIGSKWLFVICAGLFLLATEATRMLSDFDKKENKLLSIQTLASDIAEIWKEVKDGLKYLRHKSNVLNPMIKLTIGWAMLGAFITLLPAFGESVLKIAPTFIGPTIIAPAGLGMLIAAVVISKRTKLNQLKVLDSGFLIAGIGFIFFSLYKFYDAFELSKLFLILLVIVLGFGSAMIQISAQTLLHLNSDEEQRGRVFGISSMQLRLATSLPALVIGGVADLTSPLVTMMILASLFFIYSFSLIFEERV
ncbi:MAG: MFS transporter [Patescibacteria group bacterium]